MNHSPFNVAIIGMGGFAASHHRALLALESAGLCRVVAACDPFPDDFAQFGQELGFSERGVRVFDDYLKMLDALHGDLDMVTIPTPVPLHAAMHGACVERGLACYLEKPPTLYWRELDEMLEVEKSARFATNVGFNFIVESARQNLKQRILAGEFGALRRVSFLGHWPRKAEYFQRAPWAGRIRLNERLVLDSCIGNALAHYIHNLLFWAGTRELFDWATVSSMKAELSRAHAIENYDTIFARGTFDNGAEFRIAATHAGKPPQYQREVVECDHATLTYLTGSEWRIEWKSGEVETGPADRDDLLGRNFAAYFDYLRGDAPRSLTTLADAKPFVHLTNLAYVAAGAIETESEEYVERSDGWVAVRDIETMLEAYLNVDFAPLDETFTQASQVVELDEVLSRLYPQP